MSEQSLLGKGTNVKEIIHELELRREVDLNKKIIKFFGITNKENLIDQTKKCLLVMEYADDGSYIVICTLAVIERRLFKILLLITLFFIQNAGIMNQIIDQQWIK
ncbi:unnamed protein product [Rhizophagus irregularis]|nr:unnamed protein product [Rhizophagus irregularis]